MVGIGIGMMGYIGLVSVSCLKMYDKWNRAWQLLTLIGGGGGAGAGLISDVTRYFAASIVASVVEEWFMLTRDGNQESVFASCSEDVLVIKTLKFRW